MEEFITPEKTETKHTNKLKSAFTYIGKPLIALTEDDIITNSYAISPTVFIPTVRTVSNDKFDWISLRLEYGSVWSKFFVMATKSEYCNEALRNAMADGKIIETKIIERSFLATVSEYAYWVKKTDIDGILFINDDAAYIVPRNLVEPFSSNW